MLVLTSPCWMFSWSSNGSLRILGHLAAIRRTSRSSGNPREPGRSAHCCRRAVRADCFIAPSCRAQALSRVPSPRHGPSPERRRQRSVSWSWLAQEQSMNCAALPTDIMRKASHAVSGVVPQPGKVHTPANLVWVPVPDELVDAAGFPGWADDVPIMFGTTENEARYFIKPSGLQLPFPRSMGVAILRLVKPNGIYSWAIVKKVATALCGAHVQQVMDILHRSRKTPYECLDWLMTSMIWREPAHQTAERFNALHRPVYCYNFGRVSPGARTSRD